MIRPHSDVNSGSMADIAFLLLVFFLVATTVDTEKGITLLLPPHTDEPISSPIHDRNLFKISINSGDELLINNEPRSDLSDLKAEIMDFVINQDKLPNLSESPKKAIVSLKTNRGTSYEKYIEVMDVIKSAYYQIYADNCHLESEEFRDLDLSKPHNKTLYNRVRDQFPMNISIAEPML